MATQNYLVGNLERIATDDISDADTTRLAEAVKTTFLLSMDIGLPLSQRSILNALGVRLRDQLRDLLGEVFEAGAAELRDANAKIKAVNAQLDVAKQNLARVADTIEGIGTLIASLDKLISIVSVIA
jgi:hypothetical protein